MSDYNHVGMSGRLTRNVELKSLPSGTTVAECGLACNRKYKDKEETCFVDVNVFGPQAEVFSRYLTKGSRVIISGRLTLDQWEANGMKHSKHRVTVESFTFVDSKPEAQRESPSEADAQDDGYPPANDEVPF